MSDFGKISSLESLPLPEGPHVRDFDAVQKAAKKAVRAAKKAPDPEAQPIAAAPVRPEDDLSSVPAPDARPPERDSDTLAPLAPEAPYVYGDLDDETFHGTLSGFVEQAQGQYADFGLTLYCRILPGLKDAQRRFTEHEDDPKYRLDGCSGIEEYIKKLGLKPARVRKWRQRDKERQFMRELKLLSGIKICQDCGQEKGHAPSCPHYVPPPPPPPDNETEAALLAEQCLRITKTLLGPSLEPLTERVKKAISMAESVQEAAANGRYDVADFSEHRSSQDTRREPVPEPDPDSKEPVEPPPALPASAHVSQATTYEDWENHQLPVLDFKLKYFEEASESFKDRYHYALQGSAFKKILVMLRDKPEQASPNAEDFTQLAVVLRSAAENLNMLAAAITTGLTPPPEPSPEPVKQQDEQDAQQDGPDSTAFLQDDEPEPESPNPADKMAGEAHRDSTMLQKGSNCSQLVYEPIGGGSKVFEVAIQDEFSSDTPKVKYYVCVGEQKYPHPTLHSAKDACDKMLEKEGRRPKEKAQTASAQEMAITVTASGSLHSATDTARDG